MMNRTLAETPRRAATRRLLAWCAPLLFLAPIALAARGQERPPAGASAAERPAAASDPVVARVDGKPIRRSELEQRKERAVAGYRADTGHEVPAAFQAFFLRTALEGAVRERLIAKDGRARGLRVSDAAAESVLKQDPSFHPGGRFDAARFEAYRRDNPQGFEQVREEARDFQTFQRRARQIERELAPDAATLDRLVTLRSEKVRVQAVLVAETQFDGRTDPSDEQVRALYAQHKDAFAPPARVSFSTITVPGFEEGRVSAAGLARAREHAEGLLEELRRGVAFDSLARRPGLLRGSGTWGQGQENGLFASTPAWAESAFASSEGRVLPRAFETLDGMTLARIDRATPSRAPALARVADDVRARWRAETAATRDRADARRFYDAHPDSFLTPSWLVRWATVDLAGVPVKQPKDAELRAWFAAHRNEFTRLDPGGGGIRLLAFEEAGTEVRERFAQERRQAVARALAERVATAWAGGKSGPGMGPGLTLGGPATLVPGLDPPAGLRPDLADTLRSWTAAPRALVAPDPAGYAVVGLVRRSERDRPAFETVEPAVRAAVERARAVEERAAARAWFAANPARYQTGPGYAVVVAESPRPAPARIDVPGAAIEREYRTHLSAYTPPAEVRVRHILFTTDRRSADEATTLARAARGRLARGEDFATLARELSEDPATRNQGGDLGFLQSGRTLPAFEQAAFALSEKAPFSPPVPTTFGVHLLQLVERRGGEPEPFAMARPRVVEKLVAQFADTLAREEAERLYAQASDRSTLLARAEARGLPTTIIRWHEGFPLTGPAVLDELRADAASTTPGRLLPRVYRYLEQGYVVAMLDSVLPSRPLAFEEAAERILADFRREARLSAARARAEQVDRDLAAGRSWREATETLGGSAEPVLLAYGEPLPGIGLLPAIDSLLFGPQPLEAGGHGRAETPRGTLLLGVVERVAADTDVRARVRENVRRTVLNRRIHDYVEGLRARARIEVLREDLAERPPAPPGI